jgi:hypothetical protein
MKLVQSTVLNQVGRKKQTNQADQVHVTISMEINPFGILRASNMIFFESESETEVDQLEGVVIPSATPVDEVIDQIGNAVVLG